MDNLVTLNEVLDLAKRLSPLDKLRLIERVAPQIEQELKPTPDVAVDGHAYDHAVD